MGVPEKSSMEVGLELASKKWVISEISFRAPLKPIRTNSMEKEKEAEEEEEEQLPTTPTSDESRIPAKLPCPPAPRKPTACSRCNVAREFFTPPDLESVFIRHVK